MENYCTLDKKCGLAPEENHKELCSFCVASSVEKHTHCILRHVNGACTSKKAHDAAIDKLINDPWGWDE